MKDDWSWKPPKESSDPPNLKGLTPIQAARIKVKWFLRTNGYKNISHGSLGMARQLAEQLKVPNTFKSKNHARKFLKSWALGSLEEVRRNTPRTKKKEFYQSWSWKKLRFEVLKMYGAKCMCCGSDQRICVDHIKPISKFPELKRDFDNLQVLCNDCNMGKSNDDYTDFRPDKNSLTPEQYAELELINEGQQLH